MFVIAAPGQGAQKPGFLQPWLDLPGVADRLAWWSAVTGLDLVRYGTTADDEEIRDTAVAQPLLVAAGLAAAAELDVAPDVAAGHSVGELVAAALSGVLSPEAALVFVRERGRAMAGAAAVTETGMTAVLGGKPDDVLAALDKHGLTPANINGAGQIVAAGTLAQLAAFADDPPEGARLRSLQVAGAFHTEHMVPAVDALHRLVAGMPVADPRTKLLSNGDGGVVLGVRRPPGRPSEPAGPLGRVHDHHGGARSHRNHRTAAGRYAHRSGETRPARRHAGRAQDTRRSRQGP